MRIALTMVLALSATLCPTLSAEQYYKWVDDQGVTHYSAEKPEDRDANRVRANNPPSSSQDEALERLKNQRQQTKKEREASQENEEEEKKSENGDKEACEKHRKNLQTLKTTTNVRRKNPETGELETMAEDEREAMIEKTKKALERCNKDEAEN